MVPGIPLILVLVTRSWDPYPHVALWASRPSQWPELHLRLLQFFRLLQESIHCLSPLVDSCPCSLFQYVHQGFHNCWFTQKFASLTFQSLFIQRIYIIESPLLFAIFVCAISRLLCLHDFYIIFHLQYLCHAFHPINCSQYLLDAVHCYYLFTMSSSLTSRSLFICSFVHAAFWFELERPLRFLQWRSAKSRIRTTRRGVHARRPVRVHRRRWAGGAGVGRVPSFCWSLWRVQASD